MLTLIALVPNARFSALGPEAELPECHQLTRSLIERARRASAATDRVDTDAIERIITRMMARGGPPVIKWMLTPADAFDHLGKLNSSELGTSFNRDNIRTQPFTEKIIGLCTKGTASA